MLDVLIGAVQEVLVTVLLGLLSLASLYAVSWIRRQQAALEARTQAEIVDRIISRAGALAESTVLALESTVAKQLREAVKAGRADRDQLAALGRQAVEDVLTHLGAEGQKVLEEAVGDVRDFVTDLVEAQVERLKQLPFASSPSASGASIQAS